MSHRMAEVWCHPMARWPQWRKKHLSQTAPRKAILSPTTRVMAWCLLSMKQEKGLASLTRTSSTHKELWYVSLELGGNVDAMLVWLILVIHSKKTGLLLISSLWSNRIVSVRNQTRVQLSLSSCLLSKTAFGVYLLKPTWQWILQSKSNNFTLILFFLLECRFLRRRNTRRQSPSPSSMTTSMRLMWTSMYCWRTQWEVGALVTPASPKSPSLMMTVSMIFFIQWHQQHPNQHNCEYNPGITHVTVSVGASKCDILDTITPASPESQI